ncbi:phosphate ABC transporter permease subunit PstC, partial [bacterium]
SSSLRKLREGGILTTLLLCGAFSLLTTVAIVYTLGREALVFFRGVPGKFDGVSIFEFLGSLRWSPLLGAEKHFGVWPLICGTIMITVVALSVAAPLGLVTAIWLSEYAPRKVRAILKPVLEVLAGIPTVVLGFFALTVITPTLQFAFIQRPALGQDGRPILGADGLPVMAAWNPFGIEGYNVLSAGIAVGILTLPIIVSLAEDALRAVPRALREASFGLGATRFETSLKVVFPAGLSGIVAAFLLAIARCIGETMIVGLAAGNSVVALHDIPSPPMELHEFQDQRAAALATVRPGSPFVTAPFRAKAGERVDEVMVGLASGATVPARIELLDASGGAIAVSEPLAADENQTIDWKLPNAGAPVKGALRDFGRTVERAGDYRVRVSSEAGELAVNAVNVGGERLMPLAKRALIPVDVTSSMQPMTGYLVQIFLGDVSNLGIEYYSSYAVAALLFAMTFALTLLGHFVRVRFQQQYD